jgi:hypothetical protein
MFLSCTLLQHYLNTGLLSGPGTVLSLSRDIKNDHMGFSSGKKKASVVRGKKT